MSTFSPFNILVGLASAALLLLVMGWTVDHKHLAKEVQVAQKAEVAAKADLKQCRTNTVTLTRTITVQNGAVAQMSKDGAARQAQTQAAVQVAHKGVVRAQARAATILVAKPGPDACKSADDLILQAVKEPSQ